MCGWILGPTGVAMLAFTQAWYRCMICIWSWRNFPANGERKEEERRHCCIPSTTAVLALYINHPLPCDGEAGVDAKIPCSPMRSTPSTDSMSEEISLKRREKYTSRFHFPSKSSFDGCVSNELSLWCFPVLSFLTADMNLVEKRGRGEDNSEHDKSLQTTANTIL